MWSEAAACRARGTMTTMNLTKTGTSLKQDSLDIQPEPARQPQSNKDISIIQALDSYPQESLVKILARLFDRITRLNDHLEHDGPFSPATPSSQLLGHHHTSTFKKPTTPPTNPRSLLPPRPPQSPTVLQFQNLNFHHRREHPRKHEYSQSTSNEKLLAKKTEELTTASKEILSDPSSVLTFHAKVVPEISVEAYLLRILKYCPTPNGVFLSSLVYLDRLSKISFFNLTSSSNSKPAQDCSQTCFNNCTTTTTNTNHHHLLLPSNVRFLVDSWNIHRFLIASITVASKLFSDVFYTNARYAKVGGLPLEELEELEIKFLLMSDFRLMIRTEEFESYGRRLLSGDLCNETTSNSMRTKSEETRTGGSRKESKEEDAGGIIDMNVNNARTLRRISTTNQDSDSDEEERTILMTEMTTPVFSTNPHTWRSASSTFNGTILSSSSSSSSSSSCNSSEHSSCPTVTPHSPTPVITAFNPPIPTSTTA